MYVNIYKEDKLILSNAKWSNNFFQNIRGFRFRRKGNLNGIVLAMNSEAMISLDMMGVFFSLYAYWINKNFEIVEIKKIKPFQLIIVPRKKSQYVLESIKKLPLKIGDAVKFRFVK